MLNKEELEIIIFSTIKLANRVTPEWKLHFENGSRHVSIYYIIDHIEIDSGSVIYVETSLLGWAFDWHCWGTAHDNLTIIRRCFGDQTSTTYVMSTSFHFILQRTWSIPSVLTNLSINISSYPVSLFLFHYFLLIEIIHF